MFEGETRAEVEEGAQQLAGTDRIAGAAKVTGIGQGEDAVVQVELIVFGAEEEIIEADGQRKLRSPFARGKARTFEDAVATASDYLGERFGVPEKGAEVEASKVEVPEAEAAPEAVAAPAPEAVAEPAREAAAVPDKARLPDLLSTPVRDSLGATIEKIDVNAAANIRRRAQKLANQFDSLSKGELTEKLKELLDKAPNPYEKVAGGRPDNAALRRWWDDDSERIVLWTAVEQTVVAKVENEFADLAQREVARRGELSPNRLETVRRARGKKFAAEVGRRAAIRTGELASMPEQEQMARTRELNETDLKRADLDDVAEAVALQHLRNARNEAQFLEREAKAAEQAVSREPELVGAAMEM